MPNVVLASVRRQHYRTRRRKRTAGSVNDGSLGVLAGVPPVLHLPVTTFPSKSALHFLLGEEGYGAVLFSLAGFSSSHGR